MANLHVEPERLDEIRLAVLDTLGYDPSTRAALIAPLPTNLRGLLPGGMAAPSIGLQLDLDYLNGIERLTDGSVPLRRFLARAVSLAGAVQAADPIRSALAEVEARSTGAPPVATGRLPEYDEAVVLRDDMVPFGFLRGAVTAAGAVAKLTVPAHADGAPAMFDGKPVRHLGTGWLVAPGLLITNHHVVNARKDGEPPPAEADLRRQASTMTVLFDFDDDTSPGTEVAATELIAWDRTLDYALVRLADATRRALVCAPAPVAEVTPSSAIAVNIIQHPDGGPKRFGIRNNLLTSATPTEMRYLTDTLGGSSGSPVLNDRWEVVGLHTGSAFVTGVKFHGQSVAYVNVGTQITAVLGDLRQRYPGRVPELGA